MNRESCGHISAWLARRAGRAAAVSKGSRYPAVFSGAKRWGARGGGSRSTTGRPDAVFTLPARLPRHPEMNNGP